MFDTWGVDLVLAHKLTLDGGVDAPRIARARLAELLAGRICVDDMHDVAVMASELVANAVRHGATGPDGTVVMHLAIAADILRVEVCDSGAGFARPAVLRPRAEGGGAGLVLVDRLSSAWGVSGDDGTCVWFERLLEPV